MRISLKFRQSHDQVLFQIRPIGVNLWEGEMHENFGCFIVTIEPTWQKHEMTLDNLIIWDFISMVRPC